MRKTILAAALATAMVSSLATTAFAANETSKSTTLKYEVTQTFTWSVPSEITFAANQGVNATVKGEAKADEESKVKVSNCVIGEGKKLSIKIDDNADFKIKLKPENSEATTTELSYTVTKKNGGAALKAKDEIMKVSAGTASGEQEVVFTLSTKTDGAEIAGSYEGTMGYAAEVVADDAKA